MLKFLGGTFLIIGAVVGGGILAIPIVSAKFGFLTTMLLIIASWFVMLKTGLYILSLSLTCPEKYNSYYSIVGKFLGNKTQLLTVFLFLWLLYFSLSSYISGCVSLVMSHIKTSSLSLTYFSCSVLFVLLFGGLIVISAKIIVRMNMLLVVSKLGLLILAIVAIFSSQKTIPMQAFTIFQSGGASLIMVVINAFGFQFIIPSLVSYYGGDHPLLFKWMIITSTTTVLCLYIAWLYTIYSIIPMTGEHGLQAIYHSANQLLTFNLSLMFYMHSPFIIDLLSIFEMVALFGSFFCVALGVFDFLLDAFKTNNRLLVGLATFLPPLLLTLFSENMYVYAMTVAGYIAIVLEIIIPVCAQKQLRRFGV